MSPPLSLSLYLSCVRAERAQYLYRFHGRTFASSYMRRWPTLAHTRRARHPTLALTRRQPCPCMSCSPVPISKQPSRWHRCALVRCNASVPFTAALGSQALKFRAREIQACTLRGKNSSIRGCRDGASSRHIPSASMRTEKWHEVVLVNTRYGQS